MRERKGHPPRLPGWDYSAGRAYFVTFVVAGRRRCLARVGDGRVSLSPQGSIVEAAWFALPSKFPVVELDAMVVMPDHVHAIVVVKAGALMNQGLTELESEVLQSTEPCGALMNQSPNFPEDRTRLAPLMADPRPVLGKIIRSWKAESTLRIRKQVDPTFKWQSRYWDRVIRHDGALHRTRRYIADNPGAWRDSAP